MVKLTALQCVPLLLPLAHSFILPPPELFSAFEVERSDSSNAAHSPFSPFFNSKTAKKDDQPGQVRIIIVDKPARPVRSFKPFGSDRLVSILDQISSFTPRTGLTLSNALPKPGEILEKMESLVTARFDALEQKIGKFQMKIKDHFDGILAAKKKGASSPFPWDKHAEITSLDALRYWDVDAWLRPESENEEDIEEWHENHMHHGHKHGHHGEHEHHHHHHHKHKHHCHDPPIGAIQPDNTLLDMIKESKHSSIFYSFIQDYPELEKALDNKDHNITVFAPSNRAFEKLLRGRKKEDLKIPKELIEKILTYHVMDGYHNYHDLKWHNTIASELGDDKLGKDEKQRLRLGLYRCPTVNLYSKILVGDYIGKNGVLHAVDSLILPPPDISDILNLLPTGFSTTLLALEKTGLADKLSRNKLLDNPSKYTVFAPPNFAWKEIPFKITAFLFSEYGKEYLEAVMKYHIVADRVIYSDGMIGHDTDPRGKETHFPPGYHHLAVKSLLADKAKSKGEGKDNTGELNLDITRFPELLSFRVNGQSDIIIANGVAHDGVIHIPHHIFMPPFHDLPHHGDHDHDDHGHRDLRRDLKAIEGGCGDFRGAEDTEEVLERFKGCWEPYL